MVQSFTVHSTSISKKNPNTSTVTYKTEGSKKGFGKTQINGATEYYFAKADNTDLPVVGDTFDADLDDFTIRILTTTDQDTGEVSTSKWIC